MPVAGRTPFACSTANAAPVFGTRPTAATAIRLDKAFIDHALQPRFSAARYVWGKL
jgi:hypothetical protein